MLIRTIAILALLAFSISSKAQTITLGPITKTVYCDGDTMQLRYVASSQFKPDNTFTAQLSDANGSFLQFTNWGSDSNLVGRFVIRFTSPGTNYRVRIISTDPYQVSNTSPDSIQSWTYPSPYPLPGVDRGSLAGYRGTEGVQFGIGFADEPIKFYDGSYEGAGVAYAWHFDGDADVTTSSDSSPVVTFAHEGVKTGTLRVTNVAGCSQTSTFRYLVVSCSPVIPKAARVVKTEVYGADSIVWVKAGGSYVSDAMETLQTIFVEAGGSVTAPEDPYAVIYLQKGASIHISPPMSATVVIPSDGGFGYMPADTFQCSDLAFDYSEVSGGVKIEEVQRITISQNSNHLGITGDQPATTCRIFSLLGSELLSQRGAGMLDVDLSPLQAGMYFAIVQAGDERVVRRVLVMH